MPTMPGEMSKGDILHALDERINDAPTRKQMLEDLEAKHLIGGHSRYTLPEIAVRIGLVSPGSPEERHLANDWFGTNWWSKSMTPEEKDQTVRAALIVAINEANDRNLPIDCYWVCSLHAEPKEEKMQVTISWSGQQVTMILLTPDPPVELQDHVGDPIKIVNWEQGALRLHNLVTNTWERIP